MVPSPPIPWCYTREASVPHPRVGVYSRNGKCHAWSARCLLLQWAASPPQPLLLACKLLSSAAAALVKGFPGSSGSPCSAFHSGILLCHQAGDRALPYKFSSPSSLYFCSRHQVDCFFNEFLREATVIFVLCVYEPSALRFTCQVIP